MTKKTLFLLRGIFHQNVDRKYNFLEVRTFDVESVTDDKMNGEDTHSVMYHHDNDHTSSSTTSIIEKDMTPSPCSPSRNRSDTSRTNISDLSKLELARASFSFLDEAKKDHQCVVSMYDLVGKEMPVRTDIHCFWCRHTFETVPIGCPVHYVSHRIIKKMSSHSTKDAYYIRENISKQVFQKIKGNVDHVPIVDKDAYIVDGVFCSFPCCLAFIREQKHRNPMYRDSESLLRQMCQRIFQQSSPVSINPAPSWRLLNEYGGHLSISNFRKCFDNTHYINNSQLVHKMPTQKVVGFLFEKQITL